MAKKRILPRLVRLGQRVQARIFGTPVPDEVEEEFGFHVEMRLREYLAKGMTIEEARAEAVRSFGDIDEVKAICRKLGRQREWKMRWKTWTGEFLQDVRYGLRQIRKNPGLAIVAVVTLGLGIGANTAVFSVVNGVLLTPLPFPDSGELVETRTRYLPPSGLDIDRFPISVPEFLDYRETSRSYEALGIYTVGTRTLTDTENDPERVPTTFLDRAALEALDVDAQIGRWFRAEEDLPTVAVGLLSHDLWVRRFGADSAIVGSDITVDGSSFRVTGVMPEGFSFPNARYELYETVGIDPANPGGRGRHNHFGIGRLKDDVSFETAVAESRAIHAGWEERYPHNVAHFPILESLEDNIVGTDVRRALLILMGAVGVVLLIATVNVANLLMARGDARRREVAVRSSLGASRERIGRQLLTESALLAVSGAVLGLAIGSVGLELLLRIDPTALPRAHVIGLSTEVLFFTGGVTILAALLFGIVPALQLGTAPASELRSDTRTTSTRNRRRVRRWMVTTEVAMSLVVLVSAGLIARSFQSLLAVDPGVETDGRVTFSISPRGDAYRDGVEVVRFHERLQERLAALPGVESVSAVAHLPLSGHGSRTGFDIEGRELQEGELVWSAQWTGVLPDYFETFGIEPIAGRLLRLSDRAGSERVVVVSKDVVDDYFGGENPIGLRVGWDTDPPRWGRIVGIVPRTRTQSLDGVVIPQVYYPYSQGPDWVWTDRNLSVTIKTAVPPASLMGAIRTAVSDVDERVPVENLRTMDEVLNRSVAQPRLLATLLGTFAVIALVLAAIGIYGVVSYSVGKRTHEIGLRLALGARRSDVLRMMIREGAWPALVGVVVGLPAALVAGRLLADLLFRVSPSDPVVYGTLALFLLVLAGVSSFVPARRATRLDPTEALRYE